MAPAEEPVEETVRYGDDRTGNVVKEPSFGAEAVEDEVESELELIGVIAVAT